MKIEIEKKYEITDHDYEIIKDKCEFVEEKELIDYYLDNSDFTLMKNNYHLRMRNGIYELKIYSYDNTSNVEKAYEYDDEDEINIKLKKFDFNIDDTSGVVKVITQREKYTYKYQNYNFTFDFDIYQYGSRYEIELLLDDDAGINAEELITGLRSELGLNAGINIDEGKVGNAAMHQNFELYEILLKIHNN
ncbi:CYTH domain-containing protein [Candidatus Gracilibacteria bacterium 28_42_T64]|nr:CYTH domain-containing protein [Candidatus Gracilibacteria bacterium 28_42_T64]